MGTAKWLLAAHVAFSVAVSAADGDAHADLDAHAPQVGDNFVSRVAELEGKFLAFQADRFAKLERIEATHAKEEALLRRQVGLLEASLNANSTRRLRGEFEGSGLKLSSVEDNAKKIADLSVALDHIWVLVCGAQVMFMQAGFAMVEAGCCRISCVQNVLMKNLVDVCLGTLCWWAVGWSFAYKGGGAFAGAEGEWFGTGFTQVTEDGMFTPSDRMSAWFFQWTFSAASATIVSGGVAERIQFPGYLVFTVAMTSWIYPMVAHWTWGGGFLSGGKPHSINDIGFVDFAGSGVVHMCGGVGALVGAIVVGPRNGRFVAEKEEEFAPHSLPLVVLGTAILWFGWYGFNTGSTLSMHDPQTALRAAQVAMNTTVAASTGGFTVLALRFFLLRKYDVGGMCNGILAGLVAVTAGCANVECGSACAIAAIGGCLYQSVSVLMQKWQVDDPIDAFAVHGANGLWGALAAVLFDFGAGFHFFNGPSWSCARAPGSTGCQDGAWSQALAANVVGIICIILWTGVWAFVIFLPLRVMGFLRVPDDVQSKGLDEVKHSPSKAYSIT